MSTQVESTQSTETTNAPQTPTPSNFLAAVTGILQDDRKKHQNPQPLVSKREAVPATAQSQPTPTQSAPAATPAAKPKSKPPATPTPAASTAKSGQSPQQSKKKATPAKAAAKPAAVPAQPEAPTPEVPATPAIGWWALSTGGNIIGLCSPDATQSFYLTVSDEEKAQLRARRINGLIEMSSDEADALRKRSEEQQRQHKKATPIVEQEAAQSAAA